jgi:hypothetical protein
LKKELEAINKNAFRGFEEKKQYMWTVWIEGEEDHRLVNNFLKNSGGSRSPVF